MAATVHTVTGPVGADALGKTLIHEHFFSSDEMVRAQWPHLQDRDHEYALALQAARAVQEHGVLTVVDPTAAMLGRDVGSLARLSQETSLHILTCTGIYTYDHLPQFLQNRSTDFMAELFARDVEQGIQDTGVRATFIKCAADEAGVNRRIEKIHRAAARASLQTGAPIMAHSRPASQTGLRQVEIFLEEGVAPEKIQIAHTGDTDDLEYIERLLGQGVYIGLDRYGIDMYLPTDRRNATTLELLRRGHAERLFLSQDFSVPIAAGTDWFTPQQMERSRQSGSTADWSMTFLFEAVIPELCRAGAATGDIETMMVDNPRRWLGGA
jgi:phosphotriesterase-related protein